METNLQKWQRSMIRDGIDRYREAQEKYYIKNKRMVEVGDGMEAFSLLSPPFGSVVARRRVRAIMKGVTDKDTVVSETGAVTWGARTPHFITIAVSYNCQCRCRHCSAETFKKEVDQLHNGLSLDELKDAVQQAIDIGTTCVIFGGGEPMLLPGIYELIASIPPDKSICTIFSNGEFLSRENVARLKQSGLFGIYLSLDFPDAPRHDANRGRPGIFQKGLDGLRRCQDAGLLTGISTYITRENLVNGDLDAMMELSKQNDVLEVFMFDVIATGKLSGQHDCMLTEEDSERVNAFRLRYNDTPDYPRIIHQTMFTSIAYPCAAEGCPAGVAQVHLRANGEVTPCDFAPFVFGNIREKPLAEIWDNITGHEIFAKNSKRCRLCDPDYWTRCTELGLCREPVSAVLDN
jgi:MoaA/NifB/PqqE/SkfB family radical SAM enzyme